MQQLVEAAAGMTRITESNSYPEGQGGSGFETDGRKSSSNNSNSGSNSAAVRAAEEALVEVASQAEVVAVLLARVRAGSTALDDVNGSAARGGFVNSGQATGTGQPVGSSSGNTSHSMKVLDAALTVKEGGSLAGLEELVSHAVSNLLQLPELLRIASTRSVELLEQMRDQTQQGASKMILQAIPRGEAAGKDIRTVKQRFSNAQHARLQAEESDWGYLIEVLAANKQMGNSEAAWRHCGYIGCVNVEAGSEAMRTDVAPELNRVVNGTTVRYCSKECAREADMQAEQV
jgi:hypothetical protein